MDIIQKHFGNLSNGKQVDIIEMCNDHQISIRILTYGGIIQSIICPDEKGFLKDIVLGKDSMEAYENDNSYLGAVVGPIAGRINQAQFKIDDLEYRVDANDGPHHLHGGSAGLSLKVWEAKLEKEKESVRLELQTEAKDGEGGYPGNRIFKTTYILNNKNQLMIYFDASSDKDTAINMTSHSYFNLSNDDAHIYRHKMMINSQKTLSVDQDLMPDGGIEYLIGKATNFSRGAPLGEALDQLPNGLDHVYVINKEYAAFGIAAKVVDEQSGRTLDMITDQPAVVLYTSNYFDGESIGKEGKPLLKHGAFCLEPQHYPDAPNQANFPCITVRAGEKYKSRTQITFGLAGDSHH
jgi:aldose 1-epimerase